MITIPLCRRHHILAQVAGHASHVVKLLPALVITDADCDWIESAFGEVIADSHRMPGAIWSFGMTFLENVRKASAARADQAHSSR